MENDGQNKTAASLHRQLLNNAGIAYILADRKEHILEINDALEIILGREGSEIEKMGPVLSGISFINEDLTPLQENENPVCRVINGSSVYEKRILGFKKEQVESDWFWIELAAGSCTGRGSASEEYILVTLTDSNRLHSLKNSLEVVEKKFKALFENGPIGIAYHKMIYDEDGEFVNYYFLDANENYQKLTGVDPRGKLVTEAFPGIENDPSDWIDIFARAGKYGETIRFQKYLASVDRWYDTVAYQSSPDHFVAAFLEITEQKKKEQELGRLKDELEIIVKKHTAQLEEEKERAEIANRAKSTFLANMSHELRTPLNAVLGYSEILFNQLKEENLRSYVNSIQTSGRALLSLINDVLDLSKIETGKLELEHTPVNIANVFNDISTIFNQRIRDNGLDWSVTIAPEIPELVLMDEVRLRQILLNLVGNAVKFTQNGEISLRCYPHEGKPQGQGELHLAFEVSDTGIGIKKEDRDRIFKAFEQSKDQKNSEYGGTGLGLSISKNLAQLMDGEIRLKSVPGTGSVFTLIVYHVEKSVSAFLDNVANNIDPYSVDFKGSYVLVVDDIKYNREMVGVFLQDYDLRLGYAENGESAFEKIKNEGPDIVLLDMKMPVMNGYELSKKLKESDLYKDIPLIAITASSLKEDEENIRKYCDSFLRKPVSISAIIMELTRFIPFYRKSMLESESVPETDVSECADTVEVDSMDKISSLLDNGDIDGIAELCRSILSDTVSNHSCIKEIYKMAVSCDEGAIRSILEKTKLN